MEQQIKFDEHSKIAGLYINRLKNGNETLSGSNGEIRIR